MVSAVSFRYTCHVLGRVTIFRICNFVFFCILNITPILTLNLTLTLTPSLTLILILTLILTLYPNPNPNPNPKSLKIVTVLNRDSYVYISVVSFRRFAFSTWRLIYQHFFANFLMVYSLFLSKANMKFCIFCQHLVILKFSYFCL
jgi:hypothetical protein